SIQHCLPRITERSMKCRPHAQRPLEWSSDMPRPKLNPSDEDRRLVKSLAAVGTRQEDIARMAHIRSTKTLRKHFREELDRGAIESNANVARTLYQMATSGEHPATT